MQTPAQRKLTAALPALRDMPQVEMPLVHRFTPGLYTRQITMPAGTAVVSRTHKFEHPFVVVKGRCRVWIENEGVKEIVAPHVGITKAGTRRVIYVDTETVWLTFHTTQLTDPDEIVKSVTLDLDETANI